jgi:hypothetical protein
MALSPGTRMHDSAEIDAAIAAGVGQDPASSVFTGTTTVAELDSTTIVNSGTATTGTMAATTASVSGTLTVAKLVSTTYVDKSVGNALTAVGTNVGTALQLAKQINNVTTAGSGTGVILPTVAAAGIGGVVTVFNNGANDIKVYGAGSDTIDGVAAATGVIMTKAKSAEFFAVAAATWISAQLGAVSA